jgi:hypothetical protein
VRTLYYEMNLKILVNVDDDVCAGAVVQGINFDDLNTSHSDGDVVSVEVLEARQLCSHGTSHRAEMCLECLKDQEQETKRYESAVDIAAFFCYVAGSWKPRKKKAKKRSFDDVTNPEIILPVAIDEQLEARSRLKNMLGSILPSHCPTHGDPYCDCEE